MDERLLCVTIPYPTGTDGTLCEVDMRGRLVRDKM